jgi:hypothetical protein
MEFRHIPLKTDMREATPNTAAQWNRSPALGLHGVTKNVPHLFLHAVPVAICSTLKSSFNAFFEISDD